MTEVFIGLIIIGLILLSTIVFYYFKGRRDILDQMLKKGDISVETYKKYI